MLAPRQMSVLDISIYRFIITRFVISACPESLRRPHMLPNKLVVGLPTL